MTSQIGIPLGKLSGYQHPRVPQAKNRETRKGGHGLRPLLVTLSRDGAQSIRETVEM